MLKAFFKLSLKDRIVLFITAAVVLTAAISLILALLTGRLFGGVKFPESTLLPEPVALQKHKVVEDEKLPVHVSIPKTGLGVSLTGEELPPTDKGAAFDDSDGLYTLAARLEKNEDIASFATLNLPEILEGEKSSAKYEKKVKGKGYLNAVYAEYYGGIVTTEKETYYCLFYRYFGEKNDIIFGTARIGKHINFRLKFDKTLLDRMLYTVIETGDDTSLSPLEEVPSADVPPLTEDTPDDNDEGGDYYLATGSEGDYGYDDYVPPSDTEKTEEGTRSDELLDAIRKREENEFALEYPGQEIFKVTAEVPEDLNGKDVGVELFFTKMNADIYFATIKNDETGRVESAEYLNETKEGNVVFYIKHCESGTWSIEVERAQALGQYQVNVLEESVLRTLLERKGPD